MSPALFALGRACYHRRGRVALVWVLLIVILGALAGLLAKGPSEVYSVPGSESQQTLDDLSARFPELAGTSAQIVLVSEPGSRIDTPGTKAAVAAAVQRIDAVGGVTTAVDPFVPIEGAENSEPAISSDGRAAIITVQLEGDTHEVTAATRDALRAQAQALDRDLPTATVDLGGAAFGNAPPELSIVEGLGLILALIVLLAFFRSVRGAAAPLITAVAAAVVSILLLLLATAFVALTGTAPMLALMLGIAVGIDYSLFLLSRFRENLRDGIAGDEAAARATATAGSAVVFAGVTVVTALVGLVIVGLPFLSAMGVSAAVAVAIAVAAAITIGPALMRWVEPVLRPRPTRGSDDDDDEDDDDQDDDEDAEASDAAPSRRRTGARLLGLRRRTDGGRATGDLPGGPRWADRWIRVVTWQPLATVVLLTGALVLVALPAKDLSLALPDNGTAPISHSERRTYDAVTEHFGPGENGPLLIVADIIGSNDPLGYMEQLRHDVAAVPGIAKVTLATPNRTADTGVVVAIPTTGPSDPATADLVQRLRDQAPELGGTDHLRVRVAGQTAAQIDVSARLADALVPFGLVVIGLSLVLLLVVFRSFAVPITAALGFLLSTGAAFGVVTAVFEWGWLADLLNVARTGPVISFMPIILMGVLFGLAMDYQMFIVSRMHEHYAMRGDPKAAVREGFVASAPVVAAAAVIMVGVFAAFVPEGDASLKPIALGLAVGVAVDAFIVRMMLVPAALMLLGHSAWAMPAGLARRLPHLDVEGHGVAHQIAAEGTIAAHPERVVHARGVAVDGPRGRVFEGLDLDARRGDVCVLSAPEGGGKTAALLALAGRLPIAGGDLDVAGAVVPEQSALVQRRAALAEFGGVNELDGDLSVRDHIAERLAPHTMLPWVRSRDVATIAARLDEACAVAGLETITPTMLVRDLGRLPRLILSIVLAGIGDPDVIVVDDLDALPTPAERAGLWAVLGVTADPAVDPAVDSAVDSAVDPADPASDSAAGPASDSAAGPAVVVACHDRPDEREVAAWTGLPIDRVRVVLLDSCYPALVPGR